MQSGVYKCRNDRSQGLSLVFTYILFQSHSAANENNLLTLKKHIDISGLSGTHASLGAWCWGIKDLAADDMSL